MRRALLLLLPAAALLLALSGGQARAYISIRVPVGGAGQALPVRWDLTNSAARPNVANRRVLYEIADAGCADRAGFLGPINEFEAIQNSFSVWRDVSESELDFEFAGATTNAVTNANDARNVVRWVDSNISTGVFAVTITTFDTATARILDADMELNDRDFTWDTLGPAGTQGRVGRAMIENIVTHEIGHLAGFDHPANAQSTLYASSSPGLINAHSLEADDRAVVMEGYAHPTLGDPTLGTVTGTVDNGTTAQFGVGVLLVNLSTGRNVIGHVSEGTPGPFTLGSYEIENVPPGNYVALAMPVKKSALGAYYQGAFTNFYPLVRGVAVGTVGAPTLVQVTPGGTVSGVNFSLPGASQNPHEPDNTAGTALTMASGNAGVSTISPATDEDWYSFTTTQANQRVRIRVLADTFGTGLNPTLTLYSNSGATVLASPDFASPVYMPGANDMDSSAFDDSGVNFDAEIDRVMSTAGTYQFKVASRVGATSGQYVVLLEVEGADVAANANASAISASVPGIAVSGGNFNVTVTPRNVFGRDLAAPNVFTVELLDVSGASPVTLQTITNGSMPFTFTVPALAAGALKTYGARIAGTQIAATAKVSHYAALSGANSRITVLEKTLNANGYDRTSIVVELRDTGNLPYHASTAVVTVSATAGTLDNGTTTGTSAVPAVRDAVTGLWRMELVAPTSTGTATITAVADSQAVGTSQAVTLLARATGTGGGGGGGGGGDTGDDDDDGGGGCTAAAGGPLALLPLLLALRRRRRLAR